MHIPEGYKIKHGNKGTKICIKNLWTTWNYILVTPYI